MRIRATAMSAVFLALLVSSAPCLSLGDLFGSSNKEEDNSSKKVAVVQETQAAYADRMIKTIQIYVEKGYSIEAKFLLDDLKKAGLPADKKDAVAQLEAKIAAASASAYEDSRYNSSTLTCVKDVNGKYGYIDQTGAFVIEGKYETAFEFSEGLALVGNKDKYQYIDASGKTVLSVEAKPEMFYFDAAKKTVGVGGKLVPFTGDPAKMLAEGVRLTPLGGFHSGVAHWKVDQFNSVRDAKDNSVTCRDGDMYIDRTGKEVLFLFGKYSLKDIPELAGTPYYDDVEKTADFRDGAVNVFHEGAYLYLDKAGKRLTEPDFGVGTAFTEGLACVRYKNSDKWGFIDTTGKVAIRPFYTGSPLAFSDGVCLLDCDPQKNFSKLGQVFNTSGKAVFEFRDMSQGNQKLDYLDSIAMSGDYMIPTVRETGAYPDQTCKIEVLDQSGKILFAVTPDKFTPEMVMPYANGRAFVKVSGYWAIIDTMGRYVAQRTSEWTPIGGYRNGLAPVKFRNGVKAWLDRDGKVAFSE